MAQARQPVCAVTLTATAKTPGFTLTKSSVICVRTDGPARVAGLCISRPQIRPEEAIVVGLSRRDGQMTKHELKGAPTAESLAVRNSPSCPPTSLIVPMIPRCTASRHRPDPSQAFGRSLADETAPVWFKSAPAPEVNDGPVTVVVGTTFDEIVMDRTKDVLLEVPARCPRSHLSCGDRVARKERDWLDLNDAAVVILADCLFLQVYAPWCGHCQKLEPVYTKLVRPRRPLASPLARARSISCDQSCTATLGECSCTSLKRFAALAAGQALRVSAVRRHREDGRHGQRARQARREGACPSAAFVPSSGGGSSDHASTVRTMDSRGGAAALWWVRRWRGTRPF